MDSPKSSMYIFWGLDLRSGFNCPCLVVTSACRHDRPSTRCRWISLLNSFRIESVLFAIAENNGCRSNFLANGRRSISFTRHSDMKSHNSMEYVSGLARFGGGFLGIWKRARIGCISDIGGSPSANSMAVIPIDQTSHRESYDWSNCCSHAITSGAIQYGVPTLVLRRAIVAAKCELTPKSTSFTSPCSVSKMLWPLTSRCIQWFSCK